MDRAYLESIIPFMASFPTHGTTKILHPSKNFLPYPIYTMGMNPNACVQVIHKAIQANGEK